MDLKSAYSDVFKNTFTAQRKSINAEIPERKQHQRLDKIECRRLVKVWMRIWFDPSLCPLSIPSISLNIERVFAELLEYLNMSQSVSKICVNSEIWSPFFLIYKMRSNRCVYCSSTGDRFFVFQMDGGLFWKVWSLIIQKDKVFHEILLCCMFTVFFSEDIHNSCCRFCFMVKVRECFG